MAALRGQSEPIGGGAPALRVPFQYQSMGSAAIACMA